MFDITKYHYLGTKNSNSELTLPYVKTGYRETVCDCCGSSVAKEEEDFFNMGLTLYASKTPMVPINPDSFMENIEINPGEFLVVEHCALPYNDEWEE